MIENQYDFVDTIFSYIEKRKQQIRLFLLTIMMVFSLFSFSPSVSAASYSLSVEVGLGSEDGTVIPSSGTYDSGEVVEITASPLFGDDMFSHWEGDVPEGQERSNPLSLTMNENKDLVAYFANALSDVDDLESIPNGTDSLYQMINNIDFADKYTEGSWSDWNSGSGWSPIASFSGSFYGAGYTIRNLFINREEGSYFGLFGSINGDAGFGGNVFSVDLEDVDITGDSYVGAIAGYTTGSSNIYCCNVTGEVTGSSDYVGGVVGCTEEGTSVQKIYSGCDVTGNERVGGIVGTARGSVNYSFSNGSISGTSYVGGLVGTIEGGISDCYSMSPVTGSCAGGLVGYAFYGHNTGYSWSNGSVSGSSPIGFIGYNDGDGTSFGSNFFDKDTSGYTSDETATAASTSEMHDIDTFSNSNWDIALYAEYENETWYINNPHDYPHLGWEYVSPGNGTDYGPLIPAGNITACCYNETCVEQGIGMAPCQIPFEIQVTNQNGTETYTASTSTASCIILPTSQLPRGNNVEFLVESAGYKHRVQTHDIELGVDYNFTFYLPPLETTNDEDGDGDGEGDGEEECYLRTKTDFSEVSGTGDQVVTLTYPYESISAVSIYDNGEETVDQSASDIKTVSDPSTDVTITLQETPTSITAVYQYNDTLYVGWVSVANDKYSVSGNDVTVDSSVLDDNSKQIRVDYTYADVDYGYGEWVSVSNDDWTATSTTEITIDASVYDSDAYTMSRVEYQYEHCDSVMQDTLLYQIEVVGPQGEFSSSPISGAKVIFKRYNPNLDEFVEVSSSISDANGQISVYLIPGAFYKVFLSKDNFVSNIQTFIPSPEVQTKTFRLSPDLSDIIYVYGFYDLIDLEVDWYSDGFYVNYTDTTNSTVIVNFSVYNYSSTELIHYEVETNSTQNFTFNTLEGCNLSLPYIWAINCTLSDSTYGGTYSVGPPIFPPEDLNLKNRSDIDDIFDTLFGESPLYNSDSDITVPWTYIIVFAFAFIVFTTVGKLNGFLGFLGAGLVLVMAGGLVTGMEMIGDGLGWQGPVTMVIGFFMVAVSFIGLIGGVEK